MNNCIYRIHQGREKLVVVTIKACGNTTPAGVIDPLSTVYMSLISDSGVASEPLQVFDGNQGADWTTWIVSGTFSATETDKFRVGAKVKAQVIIQQPGQAEQIADSNQYEVIAAAPDVPQP